MNLYPAIDLYQGRVVRLVKGDYNQETVYSDNPAEKAREWESAGAKWIHVVDLEGAKSGVPANLESLKAICNAVSCSVEFGGGLRSLEQIEAVLKAGVKRAIVGTKALDEVMLHQMLERFGDAVAVSLDTKDGLVRTDGWIEGSGQELHSVIKRLNETRLKTIIYTDIHRDGMLQGPNMEGLMQVLEWAKANVILSGGIARIEDIEACAQIRNANFDGVIIGKALYEKKFQLQDAVQLIS